MRLFDHGYEITVAEYTMTASGTADQKPIVLCQLKSRALPRTLPRNHVTFRMCDHLSDFGHQRYMPLSTTKRNIRFAAPVMALPVGLESPAIATYRCQFVIVAKNSRMPWPVPSP